MLPGYNTNGFAHHRLEDALDILADLGYQSVALTVDYHALDPYHPDAGQVERVGAILRRTGMRCVIETGARFLLDPCRKHQPTLLSADSASRLDFLEHCIELANRLEADAVSFWSGTPTEPDTFARLVTGCRRLCETANRHGVRLAFEPEPGMLIDTMDRFARLFDAVAHPRFGLTLDVGHLHCQGEFPIETHIERWADVLWNIHIEDMVRGVHDHRMFGEGEMDFPPIFAALNRIGYAGGLHVELSRHSHDAVNTARRALDFLRNQLALIPHPSSLIPHP